MGGIYKIWKDSVLFHKNHGMITVADKARKPGKMDGENRQRRRSRTWQYLLFGTVIMAAVWGGCGKQAQETQKEETQTQRTQEEEKQVQGTQEEETQARETQAQGTQEEGTQEEETQEQGTQKEETQEEETQTQGTQEEENQTQETQAQRTQEEETQTQGTQEQGRQEETDITQENPGEPERTPVKNLAPGQHYIFTWQDKNNQTNIRVYDEAWNCTAAFEGASISRTGVTADRYVSIYGGWEKGESEENTGAGISEERPEVSRVYDLVTNEFVDFGNSAPGKVSIIDGVRGYFEDDKSAAAGGIRIMDRDGNTLVDNIQNGEGGSLIYREGSHYIVKCNNPDQNSDLEKIYSLDFELKALVYSCEEEIPPEEERIPKVAYGANDGSGNGFVLDGDVRMDTGRFLAQFGNGIDTVCRIPYVKILTGAEGEENQLYPVEYAGQIWYVDMDLNAYIREGETQMTVLDPQKALLYYVAEMPEGRQYFASDGSPLVTKHAIKNPKEIFYGKDGSYMLLARKIEEGLLTGYEVEIAVPDQEIWGQQYELNGAKYDEIKYLSPYVVVMLGWKNGEDAAVRDVLAVYNKEESWIFDAEKVELNPIMQWDGYGTDYEEAWLVSLSSTQSAKTKEEYKPCTYAVIDGEGVRFTTPFEGGLVLCHGGYLQMTAGEHTYVYDYDGNMVICAYCGMP